VGAEPDRNFVGGRWSTLGAVNLIELAVDIEGAGHVGVPDPADDVDRLAQCRNAL
jgi:hypothetical protein